MRDLMVEPAADDVEWLASVATAHDLDRARWELRYLRRALGLLIAHRDALDDATGSAVARTLREVMAADRNVAAPMLRVAERQFSERLSAYREMMGLRGTPDGPAERLGRTLLLLSGAGRMGADDLAAAAELAERCLADVGERLRAAFGTVLLPKGEAP